MTSPVLFSTGASSSAPSSRNLVEFKAGKMEMRGTKVHPITKKGLVYLRQSPDDNLMHFCWKDRTTEVVEDDLILFPDDCEFKRVKECTTGRVYVLKMRSSDRKIFFWMQEPKTDRDEEFCKKINDLLNNPPRGGSEMSGHSDPDLQALFGNMSQEQMSQILSSNGVNLASLLSSAAGRSPSSNSGNSASSTTSTINSSAPTSATAAANSGRALSPNINNLRSLMSGALMEGNEDEDAIMAASLAEASKGHSGTGEPSESQLQVDLSTAMNSESLAHLLNDHEFLRQIEPHLAPISSSSQPLTDQERKEQFAATISSSQFKSSLRQFCTALQSGQLGPLMSQFGLNQACIDAASLGNLEAFVRALEAHSKSTPSESNPPPSGGQSEEKDKS